MVIVVGGLLVVRGDDEVNPYFYKKGTTEMTYEGFIYPMSYREIWQEVTLDITKLGTFANGGLYALELEQPEVSDPEDMITMGRRYLGYFYVTENTIYRMPVSTYEGITEEQTKSIVELLKEDEKIVLSTCHIVCNEEGIEDIVDENGYHSGIKVDDNRRTYYYYNEDSSATKDYEEIVWEKGKGIVYYKRGSGSMNMHIEFGVDLEKQ